MKRLLTALIFAAILYTAAYALSDEDYGELMSNPEFAQADRALTVAYNDAKRSMSKSDFAKLREEQREWVQNYRDEHARQLMNNHGCSWEEAYTEATKLRTQWIRDAMTLRTLSDKDFTGNFDNGADEDCIYLSVRWAERSKKLAEVTLSCNGETWKGKGYAQDKKLEAKSGGTTATLTLISGNEIIIATNSAFRRAVGFDAEDSYRRLKGK